MTTHAAARPLQLSYPRLILWVLALFGLWAALVRFAYGIGAVSNLSNAFPWGIWISFDLLCGVALAAGAFTVCGAVHVLNLQQFRPLLRPTVLTGFLGYLMVIVALLVDLGRPERIWHMLIYWNFHSPLFEVGWCVMTYTTVLALEFSPLVLEKLNWRVPLRIIHGITVPLVIFGVVLSTLHQSSLGSLYLIAADKLDPLWHSPLLPVFFFLSAAAAGLSMVVVESSAASRAYGREPEVHLLSRLTKAVPWILAAYLALKIGELLWAGEAIRMFRAGLLPALFWLELLAGAALPAAMLAIRRVRENPNGLLSGALLVIGGLMLNRFNVGLVAWSRPAGASYFPHVMEIGVSLGVVAGGILAYDWVARNLALFDDHCGTHQAERG